MIPGMPVTSAPILRSYTLVVELYGWRAVFLQSAFSKEHAKNSFWKFYPHAHILEVIE